MKNIDEILKELKKEIPHKWKIQSSNQKGAIIVAYIDARDAQDLLDDVVGPSNWQIRYKLIGEQLFAQVGIRVKRENDYEWVWKSDGGVESMSEKEKGVISDSFKRACVAWGIGRFLYHKKVINLPTKEYVNGKGQKKFFPTKIGTNTMLFTPNDLNEYINSEEFRKSNTNKNNKSKSTTPRKKNNSYSEATGDQEYSKPNYSTATVTKIINLEKNGKKGKECLKHFLKEFNADKNKSYKNISEMNTDKKIMELVKYIEDKEPEGI